MSAQTYSARNGVQGDLVGTAVSGRESARSPSPMSGASYGGFQERCARRSCASRRAHGVHPYPCLPEAVLSEEVMAPGTADRHCRAALRFSRPPGSRVLAVQPRGQYPSCRDDRPGQRGASVLFVGGWELTGLWAAPILSLSQRRVGSWVARQPGGRDAFLLLRGEAARHLSDGLPATLHALAPIGGGSGNSLYPIPAVLADG
jgi:hypothetical protein